MKRILALLICIMLSITLISCGNDEKDVKSDEDVKVENKQSEETDSGSDSGSKTSDNKYVLSEAYEVYDQMKSDFDDYVLEQSKDHEVMSVSISFVSPSELKTLNYMLPLSLVGETIKTNGEFDKSLELIGLQAAWLDDADINYDGNGNYELSGTDKKGDKISVKIKHDDEVDSIRLEGYKNEALEVIFEYVKMDNGYVAQYYYKDQIGSENYKPIMGFCNYKVVFGEKSGDKSGTYARFDAVEAEPASIFGNAPDVSTIIDGASHWFTLTDGQFTGNIDGKAFKFAKGLLHN